MEPTYKFTYFATKGAGESIRFLLAYAGIDFEDKRVKKEEWLDLKPSTPYGQLPILECNGKVANQSLAIARFAGRKANLLGADDWDNLQIDAVVDNISEFGLKAYSFTSELDPTKKEILKEKYFNETLPFYFERFEKAAVANDGHLGINKLNWADFVFAGFIEAFNEIAKRDLLDGYPNLQVVMDTVFSLPAIKTWVANRSK